MPRLLIDRARPPGVTKRHRASDSKISEVDGPMGHTDLQQLETSQLPRSPHVVV